MLRRVQVIIGRQPTEERGKSGRRSLLLEIFWLGFRLRSPPSQGPLRYRIEVYAVILKATDRQSNVRVRVDAHFDREVISPAILEQIN